MQNEKNTYFNGINLEFTRWTKFWVSITLCSLLAYGIYWAFSSLELIYRTFSPQLIQSPRFYYYNLPAVTGNVLRVIGVCLSLFAVYQFWGSKARAYADIKKYITVALLFEAIFWFLQLPTTIIILFGGSVTLLVPISYILYIFLVSPLLIFLSLKVWRLQRSDKYEILKWGGVAAIGYLTGIWIINVFSWLGMTQIEGLDFLFSGTTSLGFLNSILTLSLSLIFTISGFYSGSRTGNRKLTIRLIALALITLGLFFCIFIVYTSLTNSWNFLLFTEIWPITLLGLGIGMLRGEI